MKIHFLLFISFFPVFLIAQTDWSKYESIKKVNGSDPAKLSEKIAGPFNTEKEKVEAIYYWIAHNIKYDIRMLEKFQRDAAKMKNKKYTKEELAKHKRKLYEATLKSKKGICQNYASVFNALCDHANIKSTYVRGVVKSDPLRASAGFGSHAWNAVKVDGEWELLDATFGAGHRNAKNKFEFSFSPGYLFANKEAFSMSHFPIDDQWQLLDEPIDKDRFAEMTFLGPAMFEYNISDLRPLENKISKNEDGNILITFQSDQKIKNLRCFSMRSRKPIKFTYDHTGNEGIITLTKPKNGDIIFLDDQTRLFTYKIISR